MSRLPGEDGAVVVLVAVMAMVMFAAAAFALVSGQWWVAQRNMVTATDAAALAVAGGLASATGDCGLAATYIDLNADGDGATGDCDDEQFDTDTRSGYVTVTAQRPVPLAFGYPNSTATSTTSVQVGPPLGVSGLRPLALCAEYPGIANWFESGPHTIPIDKEDDGCGDAPGNFGFLSFDGSQGANVLKGNVQHGYADTFIAPDFVPGHTGQVASTESDWKALAGQTVLIAVFTHCDPCHGSNARYWVNNFAAVEVLDAKLTGGDAYLVVDAARKVGSGACCGPPADIDLGVRAMSICAVTGTSTANCEP